MGPDSETPSTHRRFYSTLPHSLCVDGIGLFAQSLP